VPDQLRLPSVPGAIIGYRKNGVPIRLIAGGDPTNDLTGQLETRRASLIAANRELLSAAAAANNSAGRDLTADEETRYQDSRKEIRSLNERLDDLAEQAQREERARAARADGTTTVVDNGGSGATAAVTVTSEPMTYGQHGRDSYWADLARDKFGTGDGGGGLDKSRERLGRHAAELRVELPRRQERRARQAAERVERLHAGSRREELALERFYGAGMQVFEKRALNRTDGTGGYFVPPLWLIDQYVGYLRAGRTLANLCHSIPLPGGTDSINLPIITKGTATGPQAADGGPVPGRDMTDSYVNALVRTVAGQEDLGIQLLDQSPIAFDTVVTKDLMQDHAMQVDGLVMLGSGSSGQITGLYPQGTITGGSTPGIIVNGVTDTSNQWVGSSTRADFYSGVGQLFSQIGRNRFIRAKAIVSNEAVWNSFATATDGNKRPLVPPSNQGPWNAAATGDFDPSSPDEGPVGTILGRTWYIDNNIPLTFGGATTNPSMSTVSAGHVAPTDGTGSGDTFTPVIAGVFDDLLLFEGEIRTRALQEVLSGTLQVRFQVYSYLAFMPNRYQDANSRIISYGNVNSGTTAAGALSTGSSGGLVGF
jgi:HK97 family phage major capsid protein